MRNATLALLAFLCLPAFGQEMPPQAPPPEVQALLQSMQQKIQAKDWAGARDDLTKVLEHMPSHKQLRMTRGQLSMQLKDFEGAVADFTKLIALDETFAAGYLMRAGAKRQLNDYDAAIKDFDLAIEKNAKYADAFLGRAQLRELMGDLEGALKDYSSVNDLAPEFGQAYLNKAEILTALGKYDAAMEEYDNAMFSFTGESQALVLMNRARMNVLKGDVAAADKDLKAALDAAPENPQMIFSRGLLLFDMGRNKEAVESLSKALDTKQAERFEYGRYYLCMARMRLGEKEQAQKQIAEYLDAREKKDDWFAKIAGFWAGRVTEKDVLDAAAAAGNPNTAREHTCEAYWYVAAKALMDGDKKKAREYMTLCTALRIHNFIETQSATIELKRLGAEAGK
ncbi:MAG: tetratricopeptide repeat protein [Planctomycetota bacterium]|jgi:tetratricopeptide (TPR) repeat protein